MPTTRPRSRTLRTGAAAIGLVLAACTGPVGSVGGESTDKAAEGDASSGECAGVHADHPERATEHCDVLALTDPTSATNVAESTGSWSDPATWPRGDVPAEGAAVHIPAGVTVTIDTVLPESHDTVRVDGKLRFDTDTDTELRVDTLVAAPDSVFEMGTPDQPIDTEVTATVVVADRGPIDLARDPSQLGRGVILHGAVTINGADRTDWAPLAEAPTAGVEQLELTEAPEGWRAGDRLVVAGVRPDGTGDEEVTVKSVDGTTVRLDSSLTQDHVLPRSDLEVHVANLTRNASVRSESTELDRRGHVMFMHTRDVNVANAGFYDLGRTDKSQQLRDHLADVDTGVACVTTEPVSNPRARYSVHFHRNGVADDGDPATVTGSVVARNPGWGYVNHSSNVDFTDNVAYDVAGSAYNTEVGDEIGSFVRNISIRTHGPAELPAAAEQPTARRNTQDFGFEGHGFWLQGPGVRLDGNVASGATGAGIMVYSEALVEPVVGRASFGDEAGGGPFPVVQTPLAGLTDSTTYGSVTGLWIYYHRTGITLGFEEIERLRGASPDLPLSVVDGVRSYSNVTGVRTNYTVDTEFRDVTVVAPDLDGDERLTDEASSDLVGFDASNVYNHGVQRYVGFDIEGYPVGLRPSPGGEVTIDGGRFANGEVDIQITPPRQVDRQLTVTASTEFPGAEGDGRTTIAADGTPQSIVDSDDAWYQLNDRILLEGDGQDVRQLFYDRQRPDAVVFSEQPEVEEGAEEEGEPVPEEHIGVTNAELAEEGGPFAGSFASTDSREVLGITGLVGTPAPPQGSVLDAGQVLQRLLDDELEDLGEDEEEAIEGDDPDNGSGPQGGARSDAATVSCGPEQMAELAEIASDTDEPEEGDDEDFDEESEGDEEFGGEPEDGIDPDEDEDEDADGGDRE